MLKSPYEIFKERGVKLSGKELNTLDRAEGTLNKHLERQYRIGEPCFIPLGFSPFFWDFDTPKGRVLEVLIQRLKDKGWRVTRERRWGFANLRLEARQEDFSMEAFEGE